MVNFSTLVYYYLTHIAYVGLLVLVGVFLGVFLHGKSHAALQTLRFHSVSFCITENDDFCLNFWINTLSFNGPDEL